MTREEMIEEIKKLNRYHGSPVSRQTIYYLKKSSDKNVKKLYRYLQFYESNRGGRTGTNQTDNDFDVRSGF